MVFDSLHYKERTRAVDPSEITVEPGDFITERYRVIRQLGEGGMGAVYLVEDLMMDGEQCAIKLIHRQLMTSPEARKRFRAEVAISRKLRHPAIIQVFDMGQTEDHNYYFSMEYLDGQTLATLIRERGSRLPLFSLAEIRQIMMPLLDGLACAHKAGSIHRDIKPDNIMVLGEFPAVKIKILDFGIARTMSTARQTQTNQYLGTPYYMAPEQLEDAHRIDHRADLYGCGMILYKLLTGRLAMGRFKLPSELLNNEIYTSLNEVVIQSLDPDPESRYSDALVMRAALENALVGTEQVARPDGIRTKWSQKETSGAKQKQAGDAAKQEAVIQQRGIIIKINKSYRQNMTPEELYEATRGVWKLGKRREKAEYVFSVADGEIKEVYKINAWFPAGTQTYKTRPEKDVLVDGRWEFSGTLAPEAIRKNYIGNSVRRYFPRGAANPIQYVNC